MNRMIVQQFINQKLKAITPDELLVHAKKYNVSLTKNEAAKIISILKAERSINVNDDEQHRKIIKKIGKEVNIHLAKKANQLLNEFKNKL
ncbi:DUF2624 family protein [Calidifontibacillus erzurumensis]|uniref:DUF2624 domain-containing protein n=1 Tax=Calidifontibacillus erzurumensis TaxID=2741433 RepID=A0A8J8GB45_9BACI|nr:DUF2624 family protein [Calidifontibacillus erzurumensis]NSL50309.1 DUF2624 domain-containing protein [Calidifontibacillus erzurumensis]